MGKGKGFLNEKAISPIDGLVDKRSIHRRSAPQEVAIAIPTLTQYQKLSRLCTKLVSIEEQSADLAIRIWILDNGGNLSQTENAAWMHNDKRISITTPLYNLGVAGSWNYFAKTIGKCIIANDDVIFGLKSIRELLLASHKFPDAVIIENNHPVGGFSTFLLNQPTQWLHMGGFDELLNPAYFEDNDARIRLRIAGKPTVRISLSDWEHDNSSTLANSDASYKRMHWCTFNRNREYYIKKWGGEPGQEQYRHPFTPQSTTRNINPTELKAPVSPGELIDKITILEIEAKYLEGAALANTAQKLAVLKRILNNLDQEIDAELIRRLKEANQTLWKISSDIRDKEHQKDFGDDFINLARSFHHQRDSRGAIKKEIDNIYDPLPLQE